MKPEQVRTAKDVRAIVEERGLAHVKVGVFDVDGILRGKYMSRAKFLSALDKGFGFCDVVLGWDSNDQLYDNVSFTGWHSGYPDANVRIIAESCRALPWEGDGLFFLCEFVPPADAICPRGVLRRVLERARGMGFQAYVGFEYEFFVFNETPESVRAKNYRGLQPLAPGYFGYSVLRNSVHSGLYRELLESCEAMRMGIEGLHEETGPGVLEAAIAVDEAQAAADKAALFKTFAKVIAQRNGKMATFMAKWSNDWPGQSGHIHISLRNKSRQGRILRREAAAHDERRAPAFHRRPAEVSRRAAGDGGAHRELLLAADSRLLGADRRHLGRREPHLRAARRSPAARRRSAWSTASPRPTRIRISRSLPR